VWRGWIGVKTYQDSVTRLRKEIAGLEKLLSDETKKEGQKRQQQNQIEHSINKNTSLSTLQSKRKQVASLLDDIAKIQSKKADLSKQIADKTSRLYDQQQSLTKEEDKERKKIEDYQKRREREQMQSQKALTKEIQEQKRLTDQIKVQQPVVSQIVQARYDAFVSHASEDKDSFVRPLVEQLEKSGFDIWYDELTLKLGDSLRQSIDRGLANSRYGIVVLSSDFFAKNWPQYELNGLVTREMQGSKVILPIWHKVSKDEVISYSPTLADKLALNSAMYSIEEIAEKIAEVLNG
jgi:hypothetical protein